MRKAPRAASLAAPVPSAGPETTVAWPRSYLWPSGRTSSKARDQSCGAFMDVIGRTVSRTPSGMPISATTTGPHNCRPGMSRCPGLRRKKVTVRVACTARPFTSPVSPSRPEGTSTASTGLAAALTAAIIRAAAPSTGRDRPAPKIASMIRSAPAMTSGANGSISRAQREAMAAASPRSVSLSPRRQSRTATPASAMSRAATKPSPPLLPGPQSTTIEPSAGSMRRASSATARPACSISVRPVTPDVMVSASACPISAGVRSSRPEE